MARVRVCDFCGKEMNHSGCLIVKEWKWSTLGEKHWQKVDLCHKCADKIKLYIYQTADMRGEQE